MLVTFEIKEAPMGEKATGWAKEIQEAFGKALYPELNKNGVEITHLLGADDDWGPDVQEKETAFSIPDIKKTGDDPTQRHLKATLRPGN